MCNWVLSLLVSSFSWGTSDTICDTVIKSEHEPQTKHSVQLSDAEEGELSIAETSLEGTTVFKSTSKIYESNHGAKSAMTSYQTIFVAVTLDYIVLMVYFSLLFIFKDQYKAYIGQSSFIFKDKYDYSFYLALISGAFSYFAFHFMTKAWETSSSTVILPLLQFPSIFVFFATAIPKAIFGEPWVEDRMHVFAYILLFIGGLLPATNGSLQQIFQSKFWKQPVVKLAISSELCQGIYNLLIASGEDTTEKINPNVHWLVIHFEFFSITRIAYVLAFCVVFFMDKRNRREIAGLKEVDGKMLHGAIGASMFGFIGYLASSRAYMCYYQTGVVTAAESSLNQLWNLTSAYVLKKVYNIGREDSLKGMKIKIVSAIIIMFGLYLSS